MMNVRQEVFALENVVAKMKLVELAYALVEIEMEEAEGYTYTYESLELAKNEILAELEKREVL